jgi:hypothetical protein
LQQVVNKPLTTCQPAGNKQCEHILLTSCRNSLATSLLQVCYNLCVFTCVVREKIIKIHISHARVMYMDRYLYSKFRNCSVGIIYALFACINCNLYINYINIRAHNHKIYIYLFRINFYSQCCVFISKVFTVTSQKEHLILRRKHREKIFVFS